MLLDSGVLQGLAHRLLQKPVMSKATRMDATQAFQKSRDGEALLVCAYDDDKKCEDLRLAGSLNLREFTKMRASIPKDKEIVFYCT